MVLSVTDYSQPFNLEIQDLACLILARKTRHRKFASIFSAKILRTTHFGLQRLSVKRGEVAEVTGSNPVEALIFSGFFFPIA